MFTVTVLVSLHELWVTKVSQLESDLPSSLVHSSMLTAHTTSTVNCLELGDAEVHSVVFFLDISRRQLKGLLKSDAFLDFVVTGFVFLFFFQLTGTFIQIPI